MNFKNVDKVCYGRGSLSQLGDILKTKRREKAGFMVFIVDNYFNGRALVNKLPLKANDELLFIDINSKEPTTEQVDEIRDEILNEKGLPDGVIGIGGGSIMDIAKALSLMLTNKGSSTLYQGLNLVKKPGVYHLGIPTISGTGSECSMTAVLTGSEKKLGLKCDWTVFNQLILDPDLTATVPHNQWFYTGMDAYIQCVESEKGIFCNAFSKAYGEESLKLCREVFSGDNAGQNPENDEKMMIASSFGGLSLTYSEVGVCHALSYGLSKILGYEHGFANCITFNHLGDYYGNTVNEFKTMVEHFNIDLPQNLSANWSDQDIANMAEVAYNLPHMWSHALGYDWKEKITLRHIKDLYRRV